MSTDYLYRIQYKELKGTALRYAPNMIRVVTNPIQRIESVSPYLIPRYTAYDRIQYKELKGDMCLQHLITQHTSMNPIQRIESQQIQCFPILDLLD